MDDAVFERITYLLEQTSVLLTASQLHGTLCAFICLNQQKLGEQYYHALFTNAVGEQQQSLLEEIKALYQDAILHIMSMALDFRLLLPRDNAMLMYRAEALGQWCQGFYNGLLQQGLTYEQLSTSDLQDALFHISEIANIDCQMLDVSEEDEYSYRDVVQYVTMIVLMMYTELNSTIKGKVIVKPLHSNIH